MWIHLLFLSVYADFVMKLGTVLETDKVYAGLQMTVLTEEWTDFLLMLTKL